MTTSSFPAEWSVDRDIHGRGDIVALALALQSLELGEGTLQPAIAQPGTHSAPSHFTGSSAATAFARRSSAVTSCDIECTASAMYRLS